MMVLTSETNIDASAAMEPLLVVSRSSQLAPPPQGAEESFFSKVVKIALGGIKVKFLLAGFLFGSMVEAAYIASLRHGYVKFVTTQEIVSEDGEVVDQPAVQHHAMLPPRVQVQTLSDLFFYEMSYLFVDVLLFVYIVLMARTIIKKREHRGEARSSAGQVALNAANWTVGMLLGLTFSLALAVGAKLVLHDRFWQVLASIALGISVCFCSYLVVIEFEYLCFLEPQPEQIAAAESREKEERSATEGPSYVAHIV